jgi:ADP-ribose pyrophosphatase YjhB (NUDIX family)
MGKSHIELIARGVLWDGHRVLVCRNRKHGHCFLPGGHVEFGERAADALEREMREEIGVDLVAGDFIGATEGWFEQIDKHGKSTRHHELNLVFELAWPAGAQPNPSAIASREAKIAFDWCDIDDLTGDEPRVRLLPASAAELLGSSPRRWASDWQ